MHLKDLSRVYHELKARLLTRFFISERSIWLVFERILCSMLDRVIKNCVS